MAVHLETQEFTILLAVSFTNERHRTARQINYCSSLVRIFSVDYKTKLAKYREGGCNRVSLSTSIYRELRLGHVTLDNVFHSVDIMHADQLCDTEIYRNTSILARSYFEENIVHVIKARLTSHGSH